MAAAFAIAVFWLVQASAVTVLLVPFEWSYAGPWAGSHFLRALGLTIIFHRYLAQNSLPGRRAAHSYDSWGSDGQPRPGAAIYYSI